MSVITNPVPAMNAFDFPRKANRLTRDQVCPEEQGELKGVAAEHVAEDQRVALHAHPADPGADLGERSRRSQDRGPGQHAVETPRDLAMQQQLRDRLQDALEPNTFAELWTAGHRLTLEDAVSLARAELTQVAA
jgi:hypothetical protein